MGAWTGSWYVQHGFTDNVLAPDSAIKALTARALENQGLTVMVGGAGETGAHSFRMSGLQEALEELPCFGSLLTGIRR